MLYYQESRITKGSNTLQQKKVPYAQSPCNASYRYILQNHYLLHQSIYHFYLLSCHRPPYFYVHLDYAWKTLINTDNLPVLLWRRVGLCSCVFVAQFTIFSIETLCLFLQILQILLLVCKLPFQISDFVYTASLIQLVCILAAYFGVTLGLLELGLQSQILKNLCENQQSSVMRSMDSAYHHVCTVENQGEKQCETAKVHVTLGVKLSSLDFHSFRSHNWSATIHTLASEAYYIRGFGLPGILCLCSSSELNLNTIYSIYLFWWVRISSRNTSSPETEIKPRSKSSANLHCQWKEWVWIWM